MLHIGFKGGPIIITGFRAMMPNYGKFNLHTPLPLFGHTQLGVDRHKFPDPKRRRKGLVSASRAWLNYLSLSDEF